MPTIEREYTLSDGSIWTARQVGEFLDITSEGARYRLKQSTDIEFVFQKKGSKGAKPIIRNKTKKFTVSDGCCLNARELAKKYNVNQSTMYARLSRGIRDVKKLSQKAQNSGGYDSHKEQPSKVQKNIMDRNFYDPMSRLFLKTI